MTILWRYAQTAENGTTPLSGPPDLAARSAEADRQIAEARAQFKSGDRTHLPEPVQYRVLWIGYTHVSYGELDFRMTNFDREYLRGEGCYVLIPEDFPWLRIDLDNAWDSEGSGVKLFTRAGGQAVIRSVKEPSADQEWVFTCVSAY